MSEVKVIKGKNEKGEWYDIKDKKFKLQKFVEVEVIEIMTKEEFKDRYGDPQILKKTE